MISITANIPIVKHHVLVPSQSSGATAQNKVAAEAIAANAILK